MRYLRIRLRTLLLMTTACSLLMALWSTSVQPYREQYAAVRMAAEHNGTVRSRRA